MNDTQLHNHEQYRLNPRIVQPESIQNLVLFITIIPRQERAGLRLYQRRDAQYRHVKGHHDLNLVLGSGLVCWRNVEGDVSFGHLSTHCGYEAFRRSMQGESRCEQHASYATEVVMVSKVVEPLWELYCAANMVNGPGCRAQEFGFCELRKKTCLCSLEYFVIKRSCALCER